MFRFQKKLLVVLFCCVKFSFNSTAGSTERIPAAILFSDTIHNFDNPLTFQQLSYGFKFRVKSSPKDTVRILQAISPCGCTIGKLDRTEYVNGDTGCVYVSYTTSEVEGDFERKFLILTNCQQDSVIELTLCGTVEKSVVLKPYFVDLSSFQSGSDKLFTLNITWKRPEPFTWTKIDTPRYLSIESVRNDPEKKQNYLMSIRLTDSVSQYHNDSIYIHTKDSLFNVLAIPVKGKPQDPITVIPPTISVTLQKDITNTIPLLIISSKPIKKINSIDCNSPSVTFNQLERIDAFRFRLQVQISPADDKFDKAEIRIETDIGTRNLHLLKIPVLLTQ